MAVATREDHAMRSLFSSRQNAIETLLQIENKERQLVPFKLQRIQSDMCNNSSWRDIYVKPSQVGATAFHVADFYLDNVTINGTVSVIISYDETNAKRLILKAKRYHNYLHRRMPLARLEHKGAEELTWEDKDSGFYSVMYIFSARSYVLGRGEAIHNLLLDEYAFWPVGSHEDVVASAMKRVPLKAGTKIRVQSTPNGEDNPFCEMYRAAKEGTAIAQSTYRHHFYPWYIHEEYVMYAEDPFCLDGDDRDPLPNISSEEAQFLKKSIEVFGFSEFEAMAKLRWRRYQKADMASLKRSGETVLLFEQEFPEDDENCFLVAGDQAYSSDIVNEKIRNCRPAPVTKNLVDPRTGNSATLEIWHDKEEDKSYIVGIDPGKGKQSESVAQVWTFLDGYQSEVKDSKGNVVEVKDIPPVMQHCATLAGFYDEDEMGQYCKQVGHYFNGAVLCPEDNLDLVAHVKDYPDLYWREDVRTGKLVRAIGWQTNVSTKPYMITEVSRNMEYLDCQDQRFWSQCRNIRRNRTVRSGVVVVGADDHHDAGAISICCRSAQAVQRGYAGSAGWDDNWGK